MIAAVRAAAPEVVVHEMTALAGLRSAAGLYNVVDDDPAPVAEWLPACEAMTSSAPPSPGSRPAA